MLLGHRYLAPQCRIIRSRARLDALDVGGPVVRRVRAARLFGGLRGIQEGRRAESGASSASRRVHVTRGHLTSMRVVSFSSLTEMLRAGADEPDPAPRAAAALVHAPRPYYHFWRYPTIWGCLGRIIFRDERDLAPPDLLHLWIFILSKHDPRGDVCGNYDTPMLLPVV